MGGGGGFKIPRLGVPCLIGLSFEMESESSEAFGGVESGVEIAIAASSVGEFRCTASILMLDCCEVAFEAPGFNIEGLDD